MTSRHSHPKPEPAFFAEAVCRNCGAALNGPFCSACGQKRAERLNWGAVKDEAWDKVRLFENSIVKSALLTLINPGQVARDYVMGARKKHQHPLKLFLLAVGILVLVIVQTNYFDAYNPNISKPLQFIRSYSQWSFSLGIIAIFLAAFIMFRRRMRTNIIELVTLSLYTHFVIIAFSALNLVPLLIFNAPETIKFHRMISPYYKDWVEAAIVGWSFHQFFKLELKRDWWRLGISLCIFYATKKALLYLYAWSLVELVLKEWI